MSLALDHFRALRESHKIPEEMTSEEASRYLTEMLSETQQLTLSQINSANARQLGSILFSHEAGLVSALNTAKEPRIKLPRTRGKLNLWLTVAGLIVCLCSVCLLWEQDLPILSILTALGAATAGAGYFLPTHQGKPAVTQMTDTEALFSLAERRMEAIDRDLDAFLSIPTEGSDSDDSVVRIITLANSLRRQDPESVPDELMTAITSLSISKGYDFIDYTPEMEQFFDIMPTKRETRTIVPAVVKENSLIAKGMAVVQIQTMQEAD